MKALIIIILLVLTLLVGCTTTVDTSGVFSEMRPKSIYQPAPEYPQELRQFNVTGKVVVRFVVRTDGKTQSIEIIKSSHKLFSQAAIDAVRDWKFEPGTINGEPVARIVQIYIPFSLRSDSEVEGVDGETQEVLKQLLPAANAGSAVTQYQLAELYHSGERVPRDYRQAEYWMIRSAENNYAPAQYKLGIYYGKGDGFQQDQNKSLHWLIESANHGFSNAQYELGLRYDNGEGVEPDIGNSVKWFSLAAEQGHPMAQFSMAEKYYIGKGVEKNFEKALRLHKMSAEQDFDVAQIKLGNRYLEGDGVAKDYLTAYKWLFLANRHGSEWAANRLKVAEKLMTPGQIDEAKLHARKWLMEHKKGNY